MRNARILVVEEEPDVRAVLQSFLGRRGYDVTLTASGTEALKLIADTRPDIVFLDVSLLEMSGVEALRELRKNDPFTKVVVLTGEMLEDQAVAATMDLGVIAVLHKPVSLTSLEDILVRVLGAEALLDASFAVHAQDMCQVNGHKIANLLGVIRNACEGFILDNKEGFHKQKTADELAAEAISVMQKVMDNVDEISAEIDHPPKAELEEGEGRDA